MTEFDVELKDVIKEFDGGGPYSVRAVDEVNLQIRKGEFFALLGPSGCGKTTTLRLIAGFEQPSSGAVLIRGEAMQGIPAFHRPVNTVFQDYALFPHMTVLQNIMFGLQMEKVPKAEARKRAEEALELVKLPQIAARKPHQLSGGQQQRVALARALVKRPAVLLLDEPLGALDLKLRKAMQYELKSMQQQVGITFIYVTHDQEEALTMADRIAVMSGGKVLQLDAPKAIYEHPVNHFVADFIGETNFINGELVGQKDNIGHVKLANENVIEAQMPKDTSKLKNSVTVAVRPERIGLLPVSMSYSEGNGSRINTLKGQITDANYIGTDTRYTVRIAGNTDIVVRVQNVDFKERHIFSAGDEVNAFWPLASATILED